MINVTKACIEKDLYYWVRYYFKTMRSLKNRGYQSQALGQMERIGAVVIVMSNFGIITEQQRKDIFSIAVDYVHDI